MKTFSLLTCTLFLAVLVSSCQKDSQAPAAQTPASASKFGTKTLSGGSGLSYTVNLGMIDYYPFHGNFNDVSGHGHTAEGYSIGYPAPFFDHLGVPPTLTANKYGIANEAYKFDGLSDEVNSTNSVFDPKQAQTQFSLYVRYKGDGIGGLVCSGTIGNWYPDEPGFSLQSNGNNVEFIWNDYFKDVPATGQLAADLKSGTLPSLCKNSWVDVAVNYSNSILTMYINGKKVSSLTPPFPGPAHFSSGLGIGYNQVRYPQYFFNSAIDEVRVYNRPLTDDEIAYLYAH
ncbi:MAG TPA: LamG domain-containing protein [Mucilaginibacter sp.]|nr:LamG domain-containing protein [Mucilaginibacter sp.]